MIKIEQIESVLRENKVNADVLQKVVSRLKDIEEENKPEKGAAKAKSEFIIALRGDANLKAQVAAGWVIQVKEGDDPARLIDKMTKAANDHNAAIRKKALRIQTWAQLFSYIKRKFSKEQGFQPKTKNAVQVIVLENENIV